MGKIYFVDGVLVNGVLDRGKIVTGYGVCTLIGFHISTLIPVNFYGFMRGKMPALSLATAILVWIASIATTSRNAAIFSTIYFIFCLVYSMIEGERVREARIIGASLGGIFLLLAAFFGFYYINPNLAPSGAIGSLVNNVNGVIRQYVERGMDSSGRTDIWKNCIQIFKENPIFGTGFFGMQVSPQFVPEEFIPEYAHNTFFELIGATGIVGTLAYGFYRIATIKHLFDKFSLERFMLILGASVLAVESLLDNYVFQVYTTFYYVIAFAICALLYDEVRVPK
jgi:O-antigen ligase